MLQPSRRILVFFLQLFCIISLLPCQDAVKSSQASPDSAPYEEAIKSYEDYVADQMAFDRVPGLSVGFMKGDFTWARGFGHSDLENKVPAKAESAYRLASVTKTITAIAVLQLVEAGKIDLDTEVQTYVPYFPKKKWPVTVRRLLGHIGGISHYKDYAAEGHIKEPKNTEQALAIFQDFVLVAEPWTRYHYSSYGYNLLGACIEGASGQPYGEYIKKHIFEPLGMENSRLDNPIDMIPNRVRGYQIVNDEIKNSEYVDISSRFAGGGTRSTVLDLLKYARGIMDGKLLKEDTTRKMFSSMALKNGFLTGYGMGWSVQPWSGHFAVNHGGSQPETRTFLLIFPRESFAMAIASNLEGLNLTPYVTRLVELVLDEDIDSTAYAGDRGKQLIYTACFQAYSYGLSSFIWNGIPLSNSEKDVEKAFEYFNAHVNGKSLGNNFKEARQKILGGIHLVSNQAFTKVGSYMAARLKDARGEENLLSYYRRGPLDFFSDYIELSGKSPDREKLLRFEKNFIQLISQWLKNWKATYTDLIRYLVITPSTDFDELEAKLKETFSGASFYPDVMQSLASTAQYFLKKKETEKTFRILHLSKDLYPHSPAPYVALANAHLWTEDPEAARNLYKKAYELDSFHSALNIDQLSSVASQLVRSRKMKEAMILGEIALEFHPKEAKLYVDLADLYLQSGQKERAVELYKKALELNPELEAVKEKLNKIK